VRTMQRTTHCNRDCPDACRIVATVEGDRVLRLEGDRHHPVTAGFLCHRTNQFLRLQYGPTRLTHPLIRRDGRLEPAEWDDALDRVAGRLAAIVAESGPAAIFHYRSGGSLGMVIAEAGDAFFDRLGPVTVKRGDICSGAGEEAQILDFGLSDSSDLDDLEHARHVLIWGKNVFVSSPHTAVVLERARRRGTQIALVDPVHHRTVKIADRYVQPRPGGDFALAMAVARVIFARGWADAEAARWCTGLDGFRALCESRSLSAWCALADVDEGAAEDLAHRLHDGPTTLVVGWGMARRRNGGTIVRALDALGAITGNVGRRGASVSYYFQRRRAFVARARPAPPRTIAEPLFGQSVIEASDPPIRAVVIQAGNPVAMLPDAGRVAESLRTRELVVVIDPFMTDTASLADVVLPCCTLLEADDLVGAYGHHHIAASTPVVPPPAGVRSDLAIFQALAERLGISDALPGDARSFKEGLLRDEVRAAGVTLERLERETVRNPLAPAIVFEGRRFATADEKAHLMTEAPPVAIPEDDAEFPLFLMSLSSPQSQSSQWSKGAPSIAEVTVHPEAAGGIADGARGFLESRLGRIAVVVRRDARQRRDVAIVPKGGHFFAGASANAITRAELTDIGEGGALYDERVRLLPI
jgi:anaerobic selenocysteine-containing dehydrogenase